jgi:hypothetical protein
VIVAGHGKPVPGVGHYLELDEGALLDPSDLLTAEPPTVLILLACWGANNPGLEATDPLTLATLALARGAEQVGATVSELADDLPASRFGNNVLHQLPSQPLPQAIYVETQRTLRSQAARRGRLSRWAPLVTIGVARRLRR